MATALGFPLNVFLDDSGAEFERGAAMVARSWLRTAQPLVFDGAMPRAGVLSRSALIASLPSTYVAETYGIEPNEIARCVSAARDAGLEQVLKRNPRL